MRARSVLLLVVLLTSLCLAETQPANVSAVFTFDTPATADAWQFYDGREFPGATGRLTWRSDAGRDGGGGLALAYDFTGGGNYVEAHHDLPSGSAVRGLRVRLHKPGPNAITFRAIDATDHSFQKQGHWPGGGWQEVEVDLTTWSFSFGGAADGRVHFPLKRIAILLENGESQTGELLIDDVELLPSAPGRLLTGRYDLLPDIPRGDGFDGRAWTYGAGSQPIFLNVGQPILADPRRLRITLESDGSGHTLRAWLGSHFQNFHRTLGRLDTRGEVTFEAPLDDLASWAHTGGQNDGLRRLPLRLTTLQLQRTGGEAAGRIVLKRVEIEIGFDEQNAVQMVPFAEATTGGVRRGVRLRNLRDTKVAGTLVSQVRTQEAILERTAVPLELPGGAVVVEHPAPTAGEDGGHRYREWSFRWVEGDRIVAPVTIGMSDVPEVAMPQPPELRPESPIGVGLYLYRWNRHPQADANMDRAARMAAQAGVKWSREEFQWHRIEPRRGEYDWDFYDRMVETATRHGISVYGLLAYWSEWTKPYTAEGVDDYCRWVRQVVRRYRGRIRHWEVWNEPNIFFWSGPKELYAELLTKAYEAIKAEDPEAQVLGCSTAGIDVEFIRNVMRWGGRFDALTIHPYRGVLEDMAYIRDLQEAQQLVDGRPVWITEIGFPSQLQGGYSERNQASLVARVYLCSLASGVIRNVSWYDFRNDGTDPFYIEHSLGLVRHDFVPKPGYAALAAVGRLLATAVFREQLPWGEDAYALRFHDEAAGREIVAICSPKMDQLAALVLDGDVEVVSTFGERMAPVRDGERRILTLDAGLPVYFIGQAPLRVRREAAPVTIEAPATARAGETVTLRIATPGGAPVMPQRWAMPYGWEEPRPTADGQFTLTIPQQTPGRVRFEAFFRIGEGIARLPVSISIRPQVVRL